MGFLNAMTNVREEHRAGTSSLKCPGQPPGEETLNSGRICMSSPSKRGRLLPEKVALVESETCQREWQSETKDALQIF